MNKQSKSQYKNTKSHVYEIKAHLFHKNQCNKLRKVSSFYFMRQTNLTSFEKLAKMNSLERKNKEFYQDNQQKLFPFYILEKKIFLQLHFSAKSFVGY